MNSAQPITRRGFLAASAVFCTEGWCAADGQKLDGEVGIVAASLAGHQAHRKKGGVALLDLPKLVANELEMRVLDLNTVNFPSLDAKLMEQFRAAAESAGCILTNLKMNQRGVEIGSPDEETRKAGLDVYKRSVDAAEILGLRWVRPLPTAKTPDRGQLIASMRELAAYAGEKGIQVLVENFGWMQDDPDSVVKLIEDCDCGLAASPDTGNWASNAVRYPGLAKTFPAAVTCDFKAKTLGARFAHKAYDLRKCFQIGWDAGFRGPWCIEHGNSDRDALFRELRWVREQLQDWMHG